MNLLEELKTIPRDQDSNPWFKPGQAVYLKQDWCNFQRGDVFYVVEELKPCTGGSVLRYNARVVTWETYESGQQNDAFHFRTVPAEYLARTVMPGEDFEIHRNQGIRDAVCLGRIEHEALCAYWMPAGRVFLFIDSTHSGDRAVAPKALARKWRKNEDVQINVNNCGIDL